MSLEVWKLVLNANIPDPTKKLVLMGMANHAHPDGTNCYPSAARLSIYTGLTVRSVLRVQSSLIKDGLIRRTQRGGRGREAGFDFNLHRLSALHHPAIDPVTGRLTPATSGGVSAPETGRGEGDTESPYRGETVLHDSGDRLGDSDDRLGDSDDRVTVLTVSEPETRRKESAVSRLDPWEQAKIVLLASGAYPEFRTGSTAARMLESLCYAGRRNGAVVLTCPKEDLPWVEDRLLATLRHYVFVDGAKAEVILEPR